MVTACDDNVVGCRGGCVCQGRGDGAKASTSRIGLCHTVGLFCLYA